MVCVYKLYQIFNLVVFRNYINVYIFNYYIDLLNPNYKYMFNGFLEMDKILATINHLETRIHNEDNKKIKEVFYILIKILYTRKNYLEKRKDYLENKNNYKLNNFNNSTVIPNNSTVIPNNFNNYHVPPIIYPRYYNNSNKCNYTLNNYQPIKTINKVTNIVGKNSITNNSVKHNTSKNKSSNNGITQEEYNNVDSEIFNVFNVNNVNYNYDSEESDDYLKDEIFIGKEELYKSEDESDDSVSEEII